MDRNRAERVSLRFSRREGERLVLALLLSLLVHLGIWGGYAAGKKFGWWQQLARLAQRHKLTQLQPARPPAPPPPQNLDPTIFVDVSSADVAPPEKTKYYSDKNSHAANPDEGDTSQPKLNGKQRDVPKTEDTPAMPKLQPSLPPPQPRLSETEQASEAAKPPGQLDPNQPSDGAARAKSAPPPTPRERPRTVREALAQRQLPGQQMQQEGGVRQRALHSSLDAKATAFGEYDRAIVEAVTQRWYDLLDSHRFAQDRKGRVTLQFKLKPDGSIVEMHSSENTVGQLLGYVCQEAIEEASPFAKWPEDMKKMIRANYREITFTFYYY